MKYVGLFIFIWFTGTAQVNNDFMTKSINIKVGEKIFTATLLDNASANEFKSMLPLNIIMIELNGNEKYFQLSKHLPTDESNPKTIHSGDLMLWGSNTLVIFYKTFTTSYRYTKLGKIDDPTSLAAALGKDNVTVKIELQ